MNNKMKIGLLLLVTVAMVLVPGASALPAYAAATGASCGTCHVNPSGGGTLTAVGEIYKQTGSLTAPTPTPVVTPEVVTSEVVTPEVNTSEVNTSEVNTPEVVTPSSDDDHNSDCNEDGHHEGDHKEVNHEGDHNKNRHHDGVDRKHHKEDKD